MSPQQRSLRSGKPLCICLNTNAVSKCLFACTSEFTNASVADGDVHVCMTTYRYKEDNQIKEPVCGTDWPSTEKGECLVRVEDYWRTSQVFKLPKHFEL